LTGGATKRGLWVEIEPMPPWMFVIFGGIDQLLRFIAKTIEKMSKRKREL
jgi:hypothetical protein